MLPVGPVLDDRDAGRVHYPICFVRIAPPATALGDQQLAELGQREADGAAIGVVEGDGYARPISRMRFAREEAASEFARQGVLAKEWSKLIIGVTAYLSSTQLIHPHVYTNVGLDSTEARRQAAANPHWQATRRWAARRVRDSLEEIGMITGPGRWFWKRAGLLGAGATR